MKTVTLPVSIMFNWKWMRRTAAAASLLLMCVAVAHAGFVPNEGTDFSGGVFTAATLKSLVVTLYFPQSIKPIAVTPVTLTFYTPAGAVAGTPIKLTTDKSGQISVLTIPSGAEADGGYVEVVGGPYTAAKPLTIKWSRDFWTYIGVSLGIHPIGLPGITPNQTWSFINPSHTFGTLVLPPGAPNAIGDFTAVSSNFDVVYSPIGPGLYAAKITGNNSYIQLEDRAQFANPQVGNGAFLAFPDGSSFGTIQYLTPTSGTFDFSAIGISGTWSYDPSTDFTVGTTMATTSFAAQEVTGWEQ